MIEELRNERTYTPKNRETKNKRQKICILLVESISFKPLNRRLLSLRQIVVYYICFRLCSGNLFFVYCYLFYFYVRKNALDTISIYLFIFDHRVGVGSD
ncbi:MAG: hypothetical protein UV70_C0001G0011 [Parcubacteria group bacterium GW2011_GWA2_43_13]|nr:MAG: hypothetical protein UV70_C0001G0011 [Parcubacteria group bacterium GW2011_GWA2_43_13]